MISFSKQSSITAGLVFIIKNQSSLANKGNIGDRIQFNEHTWNKRLKDYLLEIMINKL